MPFTNPFVFGGKGSLCWEIQVQARQNTSYYLMDACYSSYSGVGTYDRSLGAGCKAFGQTKSMSCTFNGGGDWSKKTGVLYFKAQYAPKSTLGFFILGYSDSNMGGFPLPFEIPGTKTGTSGPCNLYVNIIMALPAFADTSGNMNYTFNFTGMSSLFNGVTLMAQAFAPDDKANGAGLVASNYGTSQFITAFNSVPVGYVDLPGALGGTGSQSQAHAGLVVCFE